MKDLNELTKELYNKYPKIRPTCEENSEELAQLIFALRIRNKLSQKELADLSGVDANTIYIIEGGSKYVGDETYSKVLSVLN
ncbi:helix-turn-helix domain-containing protein [Bacillus xiapuensis]|uniref:Helix-turn-helix domain-containing protein n=1 Tax=Bacillus xiapuensis TaxID=2014075 RepID=A0ABU6N7Z2_9BACI|nr:helix-turn-helix domain-containing protein [Bacillus xiapuensis]